MHPGLEQCRASITPSTVGWPDAGCVEAHPRLTAIFAMSSLTVAMCLHGVKVVVIATDEGCADHSLFRASLRA